MNPNGSILLSELAERLRFDDSLADTRQAVLGRFDSARENITESAVGVLRQFAMAWFLISWRSWVRLGTLLLTLAAFSASAAAPKRVLIIDSFGRDVAPFSVGVSSFRTTLARELGQPVDIYEAPLDMARFPDAGFEKPLVDFLEQRFAGAPVDLVVTVGGPAVRFAAQHRQRLFAETPMIFMGADPRQIPPDALKTNATLVTEKADLPGVVEDILQLQPDTTNIVGVFGASPIEKFWAGEFRREWQVFTNRLGFSWLDNLTLQQMQERVHKLPPRSFIVINTLLMDADRVPYDGYEGFEAIHAAANAPVFGCYISHIGRGAIGGRLYQDGKVGMLAAKVAIRILRGERASDIPPVIIGPSPPTYDWRELTRWGISPNRLPAGSVIEFREPTFWEQYRWHIIGVVVFCCLQTALIVGLLLNRAKWREEQAMATLIADLSSRFINLPAEKVDPEIEAAQRRVCDALGLDVSSLWQWRPDNPEMHTLTHYYRPLGGPPVPPMMNAQEFFPWCLRRVLAGEVVAVSSLADFPAEAARDREVFSYYGLKTTLTFPLSVGGGRIFGSINFNDMRTERRWSEALVQRLQLVAQIFANALARKVADQTLRESEARLSLAADAAGVGLWSLNLATNRFWLTDKTREMFSFPADEEVTFERFLSLVHPDDQALVRETVRTMMQARSEGQMQYRAVWPDGRVRWMLSRGRVRCGAAGEPECLTGVTVDITERKMAEEKLRQSSEVLERSPALIVITDTQGKINYVNRKFSEVTGYSFDEVIGQNPRLLKSGESSPAVYRELWATITRGRTWRGEFHNRKKNGELYWESAVVSPLMDEARKITCFVAIKEDITERKRTETQQRKDQARLASAMDIASLASYEMGPGLEIVHADARFHQLLGLPPGDLVGAREFWLTHILPEDQSRVLDLTQKVLTGGLDRIDVEYRYHHPQRGVTWIHHLSQVLERDAASHVTRLVGLMRDITERKRSEKEIAQQRNQLAHFSRVTTLSQLSGSLAHELNQPLGIILSNAQAAQELLQQDPPNLPEVRDILSDIVAADRRAGDVIQRLRALLKRGEMVRLPLDLRSIIDEVLQLTRAENIGRGVAVLCQLASDMPPVLGDRVQLQQLVLNLILNAADAMAPNPPALRRIHLLLARSQNCVRVSVQDEGCGLPPDTEHLFQPFVTTKPHGLGMGLAICRSIVEAHHGRLWAEPNTPRGAVFHFELPVAEEGHGAKDAGRGGAE